MSRSNDDDNNPLGIGPRDRESSNTGSVEDTSYEAHGADPYPNGEPRKDFSDLREFERDRHAPRSRPADPDVPASDDP